MISDADLARSGLTREQVENYFRRCDHVFDLPNGAAVVRGDIVHLLAPQKSLSGRLLIKKCRDLLEQMHKTIPTLYAPVKKENIKAQLFAKKVGFVEDKSDDTHVWFAHRSSLCAV